MPYKKLCTKILPIKKLCPIEPVLSERRLREVAANEKHRKDIPEVWERGKDLLVADGNHRIYLAFLRGQRKVSVIYHCPENAQIGRAGYEYATEEIAGKADYCKANGVFRFSDVIVQ